MTDRYFISDAQLLALHDAPLRRRPDGRTWGGAQREYHFNSVQRLIDRKYLAIDVSEDRRGRIAKITDEGRAVLADG